MRETGVFLSWTSCRRGCREDLQEQLRFTIDEGIGEAERLMILHLVFV